MIKKSFIIVFVILFIMGSIFATMSVEASSLPLFPDGEDNTETNVTDDNTVEEEEDEVVSPSTNTTNTTTTNTSNNTEEETLPQTGVVEDVIVSIFVVVALLVAISAYRKIKEYNV